MKCPHCLVEVNSDFREISLGESSAGASSVFVMLCPSDSCKKFIIRYTTSLYKSNSPILMERITSDIIIYPKSSTRPPAPIEVDKHIGNDYNEACLIISDSPKASAALSRRCLQNILREKAGVKHGNLIKEIAEAISKGMPSHIAESVDAIRNIGNFAAHPMKDTSTGEIVDVEPGEAEWLLEVLELLMDFYYVQPIKMAAKRAALDTKLASVGKPPMK